MKILKYAAWGFGGLLCLFVVILLFLPMCISTTFGNDLVLRVTRSAYPGTVTFKSLSVSWLHGVQLTNLTVNDEKGRLVASLDEFNLDKPLYLFLFSPTNIGDLTIVNPKACLYEDLKQPEKAAPTAESSHTHHKNHATSQPSSCPAIVPLSGNIALINASLDIFNGESSVGGIQGANLSVKANLPKQFDLSVDALLVSDGITTPFHAEAQGSESSSSMMDGAAKLSCNTIPTQLINLFAKDIDPNLPLVLEELLGATFSAQCDASIHNGTLACKASFQSNHLNSDLSFRYQNNLLTLEKGQLVSATCTPTLCSLLSKYFPEKMQLSLAHDATFSIQNTLPLVIDFRSTSVKAPANISFSSPSQIQLLVGQDKQPLTVSIASVLTQDASQTNFVNDISATSGSSNALLHTQTVVEVLEEKIQLDGSLSLKGEWPTLVEKMIAIPARTIIGPSIDLKASCKGFIKSRSAFSFTGESSLTSANLQHSSTFTIDQNSLSIPSAECMANFSNTFCKTLNLPVSYQKPTENLQVKANLQQCIIPLKAGTFDLDTASVEAATDISIPATILLDGKALTGPSTTTCTVKKSQDDRAFQFSLTSLLPCSCPTIPAVASAIGLNGIKLVANGSINAATLRPSIKGTISTDPICIAQDRFTIQCPFSFDQNTSTASLQTLLYQNNVPLVNGNSTIDFSKESPVVFSKVTIDNLPVSFIEFFAGKKLGEALGSTVSSTIDCSFTSLVGRNNIFHFSADGDFWKARLDLGMDDMNLHPSGDNACFVEATYTPQHLKALFQLCNNPGDISLVEPTKITLAIPTCSVNLSHLLESTPSPASYFKTLSTTTLQCSASIAPLKLSTKGHPLLSVDNLLATFNLFGEKKSLSFSITSPKSPSTSLQIEGSITDAWNDSGLRLDALNVESSIKVNNFPTATLEIAAPGKGTLLKETLGPNLNLDGVIDVEKMTTGDISLNCTAQNATVHCDALVEKGILHLKNPAKASLTITKQAGELFLKNIAPFLATAARSEKPLEITVSPEGVAIPIKPFSRATMRVPNITANLGKLIVKNGGVLKIILGVLGQGKAASSDEVNLWITPIYAGVENGLITCKRADFLVADTIHMIYWGNANLNNNTLDMTVAIPDETLTSLHLVPVSLKPGNGIQIPITGPIDNPKVETTAALAKLAGAGVSSYGKDPQLQIFGALIQAAASAVDSGKPLPPPTTTPFPWEKSQRT